MLTAILNCPLGFQDERVAFLVLAIIRELCQHSSFYKPSVVVITLDLLSHAVKKLVRTRKAACNSRDWSRLLGTTLQVSIQVFNKDVTLRTIRKKMLLASIYNYLRSR